MKYPVIALSLVQVVSLVSAVTTKASSNGTTQLGKPQDYYKSFKSTIDPLNITIPEITQTTSLDPTKECNWYNPTNFVYNYKEWPTLWETATSNGMSQTAEFKALYNSIDWKSMPNITVRKMNSDGSINMSGYNEDKDPDCWWSASTCTTPKHPGINADISACPEPETWGLTYDDGPNCSHNAFYDYLEEQNLKASMFYIGSNVVNWPYGAQRGQKAGHHIADHTWSHQLMTTLTNTEVLAELYYTQKAIKVATGVTPLYWRPAFGDVDDRVRWIATQLNLTTILWSLDTDDWAANEGETLAQVEHTYQDFIDMGKNGTFKSNGQITLTHEIDNTTMSLAIENLPKIQSAYKHVIDVATCMNITHPYHESQVQFATFDDYISGKNTSTTPQTTATQTQASVSANDSTQTNTGAVATETAEASATTGAISGTNAATSSGFQVTPNALVLTLFAVFLAFF